MPTALLFLLPLLQMVSASFMSDTDITRFPPRFLPHTLHFTGYIHLFQEAPVLRWLLNSTIVATIAVVSRAACTRARHASHRSRCERTTTARVAGSSPSSSACSVPSAGCSRIVPPIVRARAARADKSLLRTRDQRPDGCVRYTDRRCDLPVRHFVGVHHEQGRVALGQECERLLHERRLLLPAHGCIRGRRRIRSLACTLAQRIDDPEMARATILAALCIAGEVTSDHVQPGVRRTRRLVDQADERLLGEILGEIPIAKAAMEIPDQTRIVALEELSNVQAIP